MNEYKTPSATSAKLTLIFMVFAFYYTLSSLLRGVTATLAPYFVADFNLNSVEVGLLAGGYFLGFALMQLPMGHWIDKYGVRVVLLVSLCFAALGSFLFSCAESYLMLWSARFLIGVGVSACLIAPLSAARLLVAPATQQRINAWMLMAGAFGLLMATLPTEWLVMRFDWRMPFVGVAGLFACSVLLIGFMLPKQVNSPKTASLESLGYGAVFRVRFLWKIGPLGFFNYATLLAIQTLWAGPWLTQVAKLNKEQAAYGLFWINLILFVMFFFMGWLLPKALKRHANVDLMLVKYTPLSLVALLCIVVFAEHVTWAWFAVYCVSCWVLALSHPAVGQKVDVALSGRAISVFNLLLFSGVFCAQWLTGWIIHEQTSPYGVVMAYQAAFGVLFLLSLLGYAWFCFFDVFCRKR